MEPGFGERREKTPPRIEPYVAPVNGIVQPPVMPPPGRRGRRTNVLESLKTVLKFIWKSRWSFYFRYPVDALALCIPDYHNLIRHPMDLSTIRRRLYNNYYWQADEALDDFELIFENCMLYNLEGTEVHKAGKELREAFYTRLSYLDMSNEYELVPQAVQRKRKTQMEPVKPELPKLRKQALQTDCHIEPETKPEPETLFEPEPAAEPAPEPAPEPETEPEPETVFEPEPAAEPAPKPAPATKPAPAPESAPESAPEPEPAPEPIVCSEPIQFEVYPSLLCEWQNYLVEKAHSERLLRSLAKRKRRQWNWPFECCDLWREYGQNSNYDHDAHAKLDWGVLRSRLETNQCDNFEEFVETVRAMFQNALACFPIDQALIGAVNALNELLEAHLDRYRDSIADVKQRLQYQFAQNMRYHKSVISQQAKSNEYR